MNVKCVICGEVMRARGNFVFKAPNKRDKSGSGIFPVYHMRTKFEPCHGFFVEGIKDGDEKSI